MSGATFEHNPEYQLPRVLLPHEEDIMFGTGTLSIEHGEDKLVKGAQMFWTPEAKHYFDQAELRWMLVIEALAQAGATALYQEAYDAEIPKRDWPSPLFGGVRKAEFGQHGRSVTPGDTILLDVDFKSRRGETFMGSGVARVGSDIVCETTFTGFLLDPEKTDEFYDGLQPTGVSAPDESYHDYAVETYLPAGVFSGDSRGILVDAAFPSDDLQFATGNLWPTPYQFMGHAFGEKRNEAGEIVRPATPLFPGIRSVMHAEDVVRAARPDLRLALSGLQNVKFKAPVLMGDNLTTRTDFTHEGSQLASGFEVKINGRAPNDTAAEGRLLFDILQYTRA